MPKTFSDYTVGWICALEIEVIAAQAFLDKEHDAPACVPELDNNTYIFGRIGKHNVVITAVPSQQSGIANVAAVARDMTRSFPNLRIGLMVGIGKGAPSSSNDIRLGDVIVSTPGIRNGGVIQYDFGKHIQHTKYQITGHLNQPPFFMLTAIQMLKAQYALYGHDTDATIQTILEKHNRLKTKCSRPDYTMDRLYESDWVHQASDGSACDDSCGSEKLKLRPERSEDQDNPAIHYGLIASGSKIVNDALFRDKLAEDEKILCIETEAAGLMNHFPCVVVRGICDYADTHENSLWQGYAAMTAAAYAKNLLGKIAPNKVEAEKRLGAVLPTAKEDYTKAQSMLEDIEPEAPEKKVGAWLSTLDLANNSVIVPGLD